MAELPATTPKELASEAERLSEMLQDRVVVRVWRHRPGELGIEFADGVRLFVDWRETGFEFSVTGVDG